MAEPLCPVCSKPLAQAGYTERCATCTGAWIHEDVLVGIMQERTSSLVELTWQPRASAQVRACAVCRQPMQAVSLGTVALDRCPAHGVWFDPEELAALIKHAKELKVDPSQHDDSEEPERHRRGVLGSIAKLFGGD